uniref:Uncharacterized protein n=1 Tax=Panagrolaimus superbus TaxID=310955 RepID=A0A914YEG0_9BILA
MNFLPNLENLYRNKARKAAESPDAPSTVIDEEETQIQDPDTVIDGNLAEAAHEIGQNIEGFYEPRSDFETDSHTVAGGQQPSTSSHHETASVTEPRQISRIQRILNFKKQQKVGPEPSQTKSPLSSIKESGVINEAFDMTSMNENVPKIINNSLPVARHLPPPASLQNPIFSMQPNQGDFVEQLELQDMPYDGSNDSENNNPAIVTVRSI